MIALYTLALPFWIHPRRRPPHDPSFIDLPCGLPDLNRLFSLHATASPHCRLTGEHRRFPPWVYAGSRETCSSVTVSRANIPWIPDQVRSEQSRFNRKIRYSESDTNAVGTDQSIDGFRPGILGVGANVCRRRPEGAPNSPSAILKTGFGNWH